MKLLTTIILMLATVWMMGQSVQLDRREYARWADYDASGGDTSWVVPFRAPYVGVFTVHYDKLEGTMDGTFKMQAQGDSTNWVDMNMASYTIADTVNTVIFHITPGTGAHYDRVRLLFTAGSITAGEITPSIRMYNYK
jgi:hypothetical protein